MSLIKKIVDIVDKSDSVDAKKNIGKLNREIKEYKDKVCKKVANLAIVIHKYFKFIRYALSLRPIT
jgi:GTPase involved in cell partitioning and DNA repair